MANKKWIPKNMKRGKLSKQLNIPEKKKIPFTLLKTIIDSKPGKTITNPTKTGKKKMKVTRLLERRAIMANNLKRIHKK